MQDEDGKVEEQTQVTEPEVEVVAPVAEPLPEQVSEPVAETVPDPMPEPVAEPVPEPESPTPPPEPEIAPVSEPTLPVALEAPPVAVEAKPDVAPISTPEPPRVEQEVAEPPKPVPELPKDTNGIPQKVLDLTPAELDAARRLWAMQNIKSVQAKSAHDRTARKKALLTEIQKYVKSNTPATLSMIAYHTNISPRKTSDYLRILVKSDRIQSTGHTTARRYSRS